MGRRRGVGIGRRRDVGMGRRTGVGRVPEAPQPLRQDTPPHPRVKYWPLNAGQRGFGQWLVDCILFFYFCLAGSLDSAVLLTQAQSNTNTHLTGGSAWHTRQEGQWSQTGVSGETWGFL